MIASANPSNRTVVIIQSLNSLLLEALLGWSRMILSCLHCATKGHKGTKMLMRYTHLRAEGLVGRMG